MDLSKIRTLCENFDGGLREAARLSGMSEQNLHRCLRTNRMQASDLEAIAKTLSVPVSLFFDEAAPIPSPPQQSLNEQQSGGSSYQSGGGDIVINETGPQRSGKLGELRNRNLMLARENEALKRRTNDLNDTITVLRETVAALRASNADKDLIISLLKAKN